MQFGFLLTKANFDMFVCILRILVFLNTAQDNISGRVLAGFSVSTGLNQSFSLFFFCLMLIFADF